MPETTTRASVNARAERFHAKNPHVMPEIVRLARALKARGLSHYSIKGLFEIVRFNVAVSTQGDLFKLNNSYSAWYARKIMDECPDLAGFFSTRKQTSLN